MSKLRQRIGITGDRVAEVKEQGGFNTLRLRRNQERSVRDIGAVDERPHSAPHSSEPHRLPVALQ